jgi:site-specific DNA recombinase
VKNVLPPIITEEEFDKAQFVIKKQGTDKKGNDLGYPLTFRVKCGNCKLSMSYKTKNGLCLTCRHATVSGDKTTCQKVDYPADVIENQVYQTIKKQMSLLFELGEEIAEKSEETKTQSTEKVKTVDARIKELQEEKVRQYESYANGNLKRDLFVEAKKKIDRELNSLFAIQKDEESKTSEIDELLYDIKDYTDVGMELMKKGKLTRNIAIRYIDTVYVYDIDRIEVNLKFQTVLDRALTAAEQMK